MKVNRTAWLLLLIILCSCTNKQVYKSIQHDEQLKCNREVNGGARQECLKGLGVDYEDYRRARDTELKK